MRTGFLTTTVLLVVLNYMGTAVSAQLIEGSIVNVQNMGVYGASACSGPGYCGPLMPGCCEYPPDCDCDHIWDGYCQEKGGGCGAGICLPCFWGASVKRRVSTPCQTTSVSTDDCKVTPLPAAVPVPGIPTKPAPAAKLATPTPAKPAPPQPEMSNPPQPTPPPAKASSAWRFMPAGDTFAK